MAASAQPVSLPESDRRGAARRLAEGLLPRPGCRGPRNRPRPSNQGHAAADSLLREHPRQRARGSRRLTARLSIRLALRGDDLHMAVPIVAVLPEPIRSGDSETWETSV